MCPPGRRRRRHRLGCRLVLIPLIWPARKIAHTSIGVAVSVAAAGATHAGTQQ